MSSKNKKLFEKVEFTPEEFAQHVKDVLSNMTEFLIEKNKGYGGASMDLGLVGNYSKIHDKEMRIRSLIEKEFFGENIPFEGLEDSYRDIIGYAVIGLYIHKKLNEEDSDVPIDLPAQSLEQFIKNKRVEEGRTTIERSKDAMKKAEELRNPEPPMSFDSGVTFVGTTSPKNVLEIRESTAREYFQNLYFSNMDDPRAFFSTLGIHIRAFISIASKEFVDEVRDLFEKGISRENGK